MSWQNTQDDRNGHHFSRSTSFSRRPGARLRSFSLALAAAVEGPEQASIRQRYASLLLYRLFFLYFLQQKGLLAEDHRYLQRHLAACIAQGCGFYRGFLRPLFRGEGTSELASFLPGGLFSSHEIEEAYPEIHIADALFVQLFELFGDYQWSTGEAIMNGPATIQPEILEELFEADAQSREMGTYYTPRAVTAYIVRNTMLPAWLERVSAHTVQAATLEALLWQTLRKDPWRYIYSQASLGYACPLPSEIAAGLTDIARREGWQCVAPEPYAHPGETWREVLARRARIDEILACLRQEFPASLNRLITWNLNLPVLVTQTLRACQQADVLIVCYQCLRELSVLDPTCGTGAFLCAALALLQDLYAVCLERMDGWSRTHASWSLLSSEQRRAFQVYLDEAGQPELRERRSIQWIIAHNLYGVDLNEEAIEVCRLRLYLKLLAAAPFNRPPELPAEEFAAHIRPGNSLVGSLEAHQMLPQQSEQSGRGPYPRAFHWREAFPEPLARGGFDVLLGNPPYVEYERVRPLYTVDGYATLETGNLYAFTMERALHLLAPGGRFGMIVPSSATCASGYRALQKLLLSQQELHIASFSDQRGHLFDVPHPRLCIIFYARAPRSTCQPEKIFTTPYIKLEKGAPDHLFERLNYTEVSLHRPASLIPRYGSSLELTIASKLQRQSSQLGAYQRSGAAYPVYFTRKLSWYVQVTPFIPLILDAQDQPRLPSELKKISFTTPAHARLAFAALNSNLFYWLITTSSDCRNLNMREVCGLPLDLASIQPELCEELCQLADRLENDLLRHACMKPMTFRRQGRLTIQCLYPGRSKRLIDEIDQALACHYGFDEQELDFLLHYDEKYR